MMRVGLSQRFNQMSKQKRDNLAGYAFIFPVVVGFLSFTLIPLIAALVLSFFEWDLLSDPVWMGMENFKILFSDDVFWISFRNSVLWVMIYLPCSIAFALMLALAMNLRIKGISFFRVIAYIPTISPLIAVALLFTWLFNKEFGLINYVLSLFSIPPFAWLNSPHLALPSIAMMAIWKNAGGTMIIYLAALQGIPRSLYEASSIDGATGWKKFWHITLPLLTPATFFILITSLIGSFQVFGEIYIMTGGGPGHSTSTLAYLIWQNAFQFGKMGYASAIATFMFAFILLITTVQLRVFGRGVQYDL